MLTFMAARNEVSKKAVVALDWDGTLVDSMAAKARAFGESLVQAYPELGGKEDQLTQMFIAAGGIPRAEHLRRVRAQFNLSPLTAEAEQRWSDAFTALYLRDRAPLFPEVISVFRELKRRGYTIVISSSVPQADLEITVEQYPEIAGHISLILGTQDGGQFRKGKPHIDYVCEKLGIAPADRSMIIFAGDTPQDAVYGKEAGVQAALILREGTERAEVSTVQPDFALKSLDELVSLAEHEPHDESRRIY